MQVSTNLGCIHCQNARMLTPLRSSCKVRCDPLRAFLTLAFFMFASRNSVIVPRYGSSDLFLSVLLVVVGMMLSMLAMKSLNDPGSFHPMFLILGAVTSLVFSGLLAVLLPLAHKFSVWISWQRVNCGLCA